MGCPCHSGQLYLQCCQPFHEGKKVDNALQLMRSRYSAYARGLTAYIIDTTHPDNPNYNRDHQRWQNELLQFCKSTHFRGLDILEFIEDEIRSYVTFTAHLSQEKNDISFTEKSAFEKMGDRWLYREAVDIRRLK